MFRLVAESIEEAISTKSGDNYNDNEFEEGEDGTLYNVEKTDKPKKKVKYRKPKLSYDEKQLRRKSFSGGWESDSWRGANPHDK